MTESEEERRLRRWKEDEEYVLERLRRQGENEKQFPWSQTSYRGMHLWQLGYGRPEIELALFRLRKRGLVVYDKRTRAWRMR